LKTNNNNWICFGLIFLSSEKFAEKNRTSYFYFFTHRSNAARGDWFGTTHADELPYVFGHPLRYPYKYSGADIDFSKVIMLIWTTFAKTGLVFHV